MVFTNIEDKDRIFEGRPYLFAVVGLYIRPWKMNFVLERETFTSVHVWVRLYSLPLDYWKHGSLAVIGNKLGHFVKASEATRRGKYTSYAKICVEMDLSGALSDELILEVFDEEWVQMVDYEHIPFRCRRCHEHGHLIRDFPLSKEDNKGEPRTVKDSESFQRVVNKGKGGGKGSTQQRSEGQKNNTNRFQILEEKEETTSEDQAMEDGLKEKEMEEKYNITQETSNRKETMNSEVEAEMDLEMTQSETYMEDYELQEILEKEHLDLEGFLMQGTTGGLDSLPQEDCNRIQQLFLWKNQEGELETGTTTDKLEKKGVKTMKPSLGVAPRNMGKKRGRKKQKELLMECGKLMIDSGKMKDLTSYSFTSL